MAGVKGKSGRKRSSKSRADAMRSLTNKLPMAIDVIIETAEGTNKDRMRYEAAVEIKDSVQGKPKQQAEIDMSGGELLGTGLVVELFKILEQKRRELLEGSIDVKPIELKEGEDGQSITEGTSQRKDEALQGA